MLRVGIVCSLLILGVTSCKTEVLLTPIENQPDTLQQVVPSAHPIVFSSLRDSSAGKSNLEVLATTLDGKDFVNLSRNAAQDVDPSWSPDGRVVAFASNRNGSYDVFVMKADGSEIRQLTYDTLDERYPRWSPDGKRIIYESQKDGFQACSACGRYTDLFVVDADGSRISNLTATPTKSEHWATWSPDGKSIAFTRSDSSGTAIYVAGVDGSNLHRLHPPDSRFSDDVAAWSPDGTRIAYSAYNLNHPFATDTYVILSVNVDGTDMRTLTPTTGYNSCRLPSWSPDGKKIVFNRDAVDESWGRFSTQNLWVMNPDGTNQVQITTDRAFANQLGGPQAWTR